RLSRPRWFRLYGLRQSHQGPGSGRQNQGRGGRRHEGPAERAGGADRDSIGHRRETSKITPPTITKHTGHIMTKVLITTNMGNITAELDADKAPKTVANFLEYAAKGHYNNTIFHRVIGDFMIQGGGFEPGMKQKPADQT